MSWDDITHVKAPPTQAVKAPVTRDQAYLIVLAGSSMGEMFKITHEKTVIGRGQRADVRMKGGFEPACAKACPTDSIQFGEVDELRERAEKRLAKLETLGWNGAQLYGESPDDGVGGFGAFFLLLDEPEVYGLPPDPVVPTRNLGEMWAAAGLAAGALAIGVVGAFLGGSR